MPGGAMIAVGLVMIGMLGVVGIIVLAWVRFAGCTVTEATNGLAKVIRALCPRR